MIYFQKSFLTIRADEQRSLAHVKWNRFENSYEYRTGLEAVLALAHEKQVRNWIFDLKDISVIRLPDQEWTATEYLPRFFNTSLQRIVIIGAEDFFSHSSITRIMKFMPPVRDYEVHHAPNFEAALDWINSLS